MSLPEDKTKRNTRVKREPIDFVQRVEKYATEKGLSYNEALNDFKPAQSAAAATDKPTNTPEKTKEVQHMPEPFCPDCLKKDIAAKDKDREHAAQVKELTDRASAADARAQQAEKDGQEMPSLDAVINHCTTCPEHKGQLEKYNERILADFVKNMKPETVKELMRMHKIEPMPDKIIIGENLARRIK